MIKIKLNNYECEIDSYNRNTNIIENGTVNSIAYANIINGNIGELNALLGTNISSIEIYFNSNKIYELQDITAEITSVNEYLSGDRMSYNINITFKQGE